MVPSRFSNHVASFYGSARANNGKGALDNTPETLPWSLLYDVLYCFVFVYGFWAVPVPTTARARTHHTPGTPGTREHLPNNPVFK
eukprot:8644117-Pyramimonas_sp.AAC.1